MKVKEMEMSKRDSMQSKKQQRRAFLSKSVWPTDIWSTPCLFDAIVTPPYLVNQSLLIPRVLAKCLSAEWFLTKRHGAKASKEKTICNFFPKKSNFFRMQNFFFPKSIQRCMLYQKSYTM
jgi:hypothetical protein